MTTGILILQALTSVVERWELILVAGPILLSPLTAIQAQR